MYWFIARTGGGYLAGQIWAGAALLVGVLAFVGARVIMGPVRIIVVSSLYVTLDQVVLTPYLASHVTSVMEQTHLPR